jgi:septum site-determining protein MinD
LAVDLLGVVPEDKSIVLATDRGTPVSLNKRLWVSQAYRNIAQRIMGNNVPLMDFREPGLLDSISRIFGR